jgi:hypothetical protein
VEICTAIVAACAPCLKPLFRSLLDSTIITRAKSRPGKHTYERQSGVYDRVQDSTPGQEPQYSSDASGGETTRTGSQEHVVVPLNGLLVSKTFEVSVE